MKFDKHNFKVTDNKDGSITVDPIPRCKMCDKDLTNKNITKLEQTIADSDGYGFTFIEFNICDECYNKYFK